MIPKDPVILLSYINTKLRDCYSNLDDLCISLNLSKNSIEKQLKLIDYRYNEHENQFI